MFRSGLAIIRPPYRNFRYMQCNFVFLTHFGKLTIISRASSPYTGHYVNCAIPAVVFVVVFTQFSLRINSTEQDCLLRS